MSCFIKFEKWVTIFASIFTLFGVLVTILQLINLNQRSVIDVKFFSESVKSEIPFNISVMPYNISKDIVPSIYGIALAFCNDIKASTIDKRWFADDTHRLYFFESSRPLIPKVGVAGFNMQLDSIGKLTIQTKITKNAAPIAMIISYGEKVKATQSLAYLKRNTDNKFEYEYQNIALNQSLFEASFKNCFGTEPEHPMLPRPQYQCSSQLCNFFKNL